MAPAAATELDDVHRILDQAEARLRRWDTPLESALLAVTDRRFTREVATMGVRLRRDGIATLLINPDFVCDVGADGAAFVLCHEALHLLFDHLRFDGRQDEAWRMACEVVINHWVMLSTGRPLPRSQSMGTPVGVDPHAVHDAYTAAVKHPVAYSAFVLTDERCAAHLRAMPTDRTPTIDCDHDAAAGGPEEDATGATDAVEQVLEQAVSRARDGDEVLRQRLLDLEDAVPGAAAWSRLGVSELRATTQRLGSTRLWQHQLAHVLGQTLQPVMQLRYDRKVGWWDADLLAPLGITLDPDVGMPLHLGPAIRRLRQVAIYLDTSGSVGDDTIAAAADTVGTIPDTLTHWRSFDHDVHPFEPGDGLVGGGGTSFDAVADDADALDEQLDDPLDAVVVLTDGHAPPIAPPDPQRWIWLIVADGDAWPQDRGMRTVRITDL